MKSRLVRSLAIPGSDVQVLFGRNVVDYLGAAVRSIGARRVLMVTDPGLRRAGHPDRAAESLRSEGLELFIYEDVIENPTTRTVEAARRAAADFDPDAIVGLGGGSAMDTAKGVNFLLSNGGAMEDYWGTNKAPRPMLPLVAVPTTAGTGSEAQSYALISQAESHTKMACGDKKALPRFAILDPELTRTQPPAVAAATGIDAVAHAVETAACNRRNATSRGLSKQAWHLLEASFEQALLRPEDATARANMLLGAHYAGCAIENAMLGGAHAAANPLTARFGIPHGVAVGIMLPRVIRFNAPDSAENPYSDLCGDADLLARRIEAMLATARLPMLLSQLRIPREALPELAHLAAQQWTANFNPRPVAPEDLLSLYTAAYE